MPKPNSISFRPSLDKGDFFQLKKSELCWFVLEPVASMIYHSTNKQQALDTLSKGQQALYYWWFLSNQSLGTFYYFFKNNYYEYLPNILKGMEDIEDIAAAQILRDLIKEIKIDEDGYEISDEVLETHSLKYYDIFEESILHFEQYIRDHPNDFLVDENGEKLTVG